MYMYNDLYYIYIYILYVLVQFILSLSDYIQNTGSSVYYNEEEDEDDPELLVTDNTSPEDLELSLGSK